MDHKDNDAPLRKLASAEDLRGKKRVDSHVIFAEEAEREAKEAARNAKQKENERSFTPAAPSQTQG